MIAVDRGMRSRVQGLTNSADLEIRLTAVDALKDIRRSTRYAIAETRRFQMTYPEAIKFL